MTSDSPSIGLLKLTRMDSVAPMDLFSRLATTSSSSSSFPPGGGTCGGGAPESSEQAATMNTTSSANSHRCNISRFLRTTHGNATRESEAHESRLGLSWGRGNYSSPSSDYSVQPRTVSRRPLKE